MKYFALLDTEDLVIIGDYPSVYEALDNKPGNAVWIFSEDELRALEEKIQEALKTKAQILAENPNLISYRVMLYEEPEEPGDTEFQRAFDCYAEDDDHAADQALNAYPQGVILSITPFMGNDDELT